MHFSCNNSFFLKGILLLSNICQSKSTKQILQAVKIIVDDSEIQLLATDLEIAVRYKITDCKVNEKGITALPLNKLLNMIKEIKDDNIEIKCNNQICHINSKDVQYKLITDNYEEFPLIPEYDFKDSVIINAKQFSIFSNKTVFSVAKDISCYSYNGVLLEIFEDGIKFVSTDGRRLSIAGNISNERENILFSAIVPVKGIIQITKTIKNDLDDVLLKIYKNQFIAKIDNVEVASRLLEGEYPKYKDVIPKDNINLVRINVEDLILSLRKASITAGNEVRAVQFIFNKNTLTLFSQQEGIGESKTEIPIKYSGDILNITFNPDYIMDFIKEVNNDEVIFRIKDGSSSCIIEDSENEFYIIMPITNN